MKLRRLFPLSLLSGSRFLLIYSALLACSSYPPSSAQAREAADDSSLTALSIEQLLDIEVPTVNGACRYDQKVTDAPAAVSVITADEIKRYGYRTLADILRSVRGFWVSNDRNYQYLGVRGFSRPGDYNSRVLLLIDGHRLNNGIYDQAPVGTDFPLDVDLIERVEVIRGPSSSLYGTSAFFGVLNVITRQGKDLKTVEAAGAAGTQESYGGRLSYGTKLPGGVELLVSGSRYSTEGDDRIYFSEFDRLGYHNGIASNSDGDDWYSFFSKISFRDLTLSGLYGSREKQIPTGVYQTVFNDPRNRSTDSYGYLDLTYSRKWDTLWELSARVAYDNFYYRGTYIYSGETAGDPFIVNKDSAKGDWLTGELLLTSRVLENQTISAGFEDRYHLALEQRTYYEEPYEVLLDDRRNPNMTALFLQDEYHLLPNLTLIGGLRWDHYQSFGGTWSPRLAAVYKPFDMTVLKLIYGRAFRAPNVYEMYYDDGISYRGNSELQPERIRTAELVWEQYVGEHFRSSLSAYHYWIEQLITQQSEGGFIIYRNVDEVQAQGLEAEAEVRWVDGLQGRVSYVLQRAEDHREDTGLTNSPRHQVKLNLNYPLMAQKLFAGGEFQYTSSRKTLLGRDSGSFFITNLTLFSQNLLKGLELSGTVYNLFDKRYRDPVAGELAIDPEAPELGLDTVRQDGRTFRAKLTYRF